MNNANGSWDSSCMNLLALVYPQFASELLGELVTMRIPGPYHKPPELKLHVRVCASLCAGGVGKRAQGPAFKEITSLGLPWRSSG